MFKGKKAGQVVIPTGRAQHLLATCRWQVDVFLSLFPREAQHFLLSLRYEPAVSMQSQERQFEPSVGIIAFMEHGVTGAEVLCKKKKSADR